MISSLPTRPLHTRFLPSGDQSARYQPAPTVTPLPVSTSATRISGDGRSGSTRQQAILRPSGDQLGQSPSHSLLTPVPSTRAMKMLALGLAPPTSGPPDE